MIRKLLMITVAALLSFAPMEISAETAAGIRQMGREEQISSSYGSRKLIYQEKEARLSEATCRAFVEEALRHAGEEPAARP